MNLIFLFKIILLFLFTGGNIFPFRRFPLNGANHVLKTYIFLTPSRGEEEKEGESERWDKITVLESDWKKTNFIPIKLN